MNMEVKARAKALSFQQPYLNKLKLNACTRILISHEFVVGIEIVETRENVRG